MEHDVIPSGQIHAPHNWRVATAAARLALPVTTADVGKLCWQQDDNSQWLLVTASPVTWASTGGGDQLMADHLAAVDPHSQYTTAVRAAAAAPVQSVSGRTGAVALTKADVGLGLVDNTSDAAKPISTAVQTALNSKAVTTHAHALATSSEDGFLSAADKAKLDGISMGAGNYSLPASTDSVLGGVKIGTGLTVDVGGVVSVVYGAVANTAVRGDDIRVLADQAAATASIRTIGAGALQAAAGNHTHPPQIDITGNANTATSLKTARAINGVSFDGSGDITVTATDSVAREPAISAGTVTQYWRGDKTWRDIYVDVRAATLTGLSVGTNAVVTAADTVLDALGKLQRQMSDVQPALDNRLQVSANLAEFSTEEAKTAARTNLGLDVIDGGTFY